MENYQTPNEKIVRIEKALLRGKRPRSLGNNARIGHHGSSINDAVVRVYTENGAWGIGPSNIRLEEAKAILGKKIIDLFQLPDGSLHEGRSIDLPLWDLVARILDLPLYQLLGARGNKNVELYDASIYIDDINLNDDETISLYESQIESGLSLGYCNFKVKIGRGARWMEQLKGLMRDALVIRSVRRASLPNSKIMIDGNMGFTLNGACALLDLCADNGIHWFEEPFAEDRPLNQALKEHIINSGWDILIADGEFEPPSYFFEMAKEGLIDVVQHDFCDYGLTWWRATAAKLETWGTLCAPHTWGSFIERYHHAHFAASIPNFSLLEAAPAEMPGIIEDGWLFQNGKLHVPDTPGVGIEIEDRIFTHALEDLSAFSLSL